MSQRTTAAIADLDDQVAIVTGGGQGIGRGIGLALAAAGARVMVAGRTVAKCQAVAEEIVARGGQASAVACDVKSAADIAATVESVQGRWGRIDILVNNAQEVPFGSLLSLADDDYRAGWESGPLATKRFMQACHPALALGGGTIINLGSNSGIMPHPSTGTGVYGALKEEIRALTRSAALEWASDGIRAFTLLPIASTPAMEWFREAAPDRYAAVLDDIPMGRLGDAEHDIGAVVVFLCSPAAQYMTGTSIPVDGGAARL